MYDFGIKRIAGIESLVDLAEKEIFPGIRVMRLEQSGAHDRAQRQGDYRGDDDGYRDGDGELPEQLSGDARKETYRNEYGAEHQGHGYKGASDSAHGFLCGFIWRQVLFCHDSVHILDHHDGVVHHNTDGKYQSQQGHHVEGEAEHEHDAEGSDKGYRHRYGGNYCRPPALEREENHENHQEKSLEESLVHMVD